MTDAPTSHTRVIPRKNRKGQVVLVVRERYLRRDLPCGSPLCTHPVCATGLPSSTAPQLSTSATHYVLPEVAVVVHFWELFTEPDVTDVIFLQGALEEVQEHSPQRTYRIVRDLVTDPRRHNTLFYNENHIETHVESIAGESHEQRNVRASLVATHWFMDHLSHRLPIIFLSEDANVRAEARLSGIKALSWHEYIAQWKGDATGLRELYESLVSSALKQQLEDGGPKTLIFEEHKPDDLVTLGLESGKYVRGTLRVNKNNPEVAYVHGREWRGGEECIVKVFIPSKIARNRAVHLDVVAVEILPVFQWVAPSASLKRAAHVHAETDQMAGTVSCPTGRVVAILQRNWRPYVCSFPEDAGRADGVSKTESILVIPMDVRIPKIRIRTRQIAQLASARIVVRIHSWSRGSSYPDGHYVRCLGEIGDLEAETRAILVEHGITSTTEFSAGVLKCLPQIPVGETFVIPQEDIPRRRDLRSSHTIFSIDPVGCQDVDDTLSYEVLPNGNIQVGVHIADVTYFVKQDTLLDVEARDRGTTVYLVDRRLDMLPTLLSTNLCSLLVDHDRLAVSVLWEFSRRSFHIKNVWFGRTVIRSKYQLAYEQADDLQAGGTGYLVGPSSLQDISSEEREQLRSRIVGLMEVARALKKRRTDLGALELEGLEIHFSLDAAKNPTELAAPRDMEIHHTVAEFMILANETVAERLVLHYPSTSLLRRHPAPPPNKFDRLRDAFRSKGFEFDASENWALSNSLAHATDPNDPNVNVLLRAMTSQAMAEAEYFSTGMVTRAQFYHYGLGLQFYTHFTSPIRRYADIIVHRLLLSTLQDPLPETPFPGSVLVDIADHINERHREAKYAQAESQSVFLHLYFRNRVDIVQGMVVDVRANALKIFVPQYRIRGVAFLQDRERRTVVVPIEGGTHDDPEYSPDGALVYNDRERTVTVVDPCGRLCVFHLFDYVRLRMAVEFSRAHRDSIRLEILQRIPSDGKWRRSRDAAGKSDDFSMFKEALRQENEGRSTFAFDILHGHTPTPPPSTTRTTLYELCEDLGRLSLSRDVLTIKDVEFQLEENLERLRRKVLRRERIRREWEDVAVDAIPVAIRRNVQQIEQERAQMERIEQKLSRITRTT